MHACTHVNDQFYFFKLDIVADEDRDECTGEWPDNSTMLSLAYDYNITGSVCDNCN